MENIISERIKEIRKENGLTQSQFGNIFNVSQDTVSLWEKGKAFPAAEYIIKIAKYFNISSDYLLGLTDF